ncbi:hypothetical protein OQA88_8093 [Cercophora sp. LCS_1]
MALSVPADHVLSAISTTSANITRFIRSNRSAHAGLSLVARELSDLRLVLDLLVHETNIPSQISNQLLALLDGCCDALVSIDIVLAHSPDWTSRSSLEVSRHIGKLESLRRAISLALEVAIVAGSSQDDERHTATKIQITNEADDLLSRYAIADDGNIRSLIEPYLDVVTACLPLSPPWAQREQSGFRLVEGGLSHQQHPLPPPTRPFTGMRPIVLPSPQPSLSWPVQQTHALHTEVGHGTWQPQASESGPESAKFEPAPFSKKYPDSLTTETEPGRWSEAYQANVLTIGTSSYSRNPSIRSTLEHADSVRSSISGHRPSLTMGQVSLAEARAVTPELASGMLSPESFQNHPLTTRSTVSHTSTMRSPLRLHQGTLSFVSAATSALSLPQSTTRLEIASARHLAEKGKGQDLVHIDSSSTGTMIACRHSNKHLKIWSIHKNAVQATIKPSSYVQPQPRSREYFVRSHAILSENDGLVGVSTHFGITLEIYNFAKSGSSPKKVQVIEDAHRWASSQLDAFHTDIPPLAVYRPRGHRIDRFFLVRHPSAKKPFWEDASNGISLERAGLPFIPQFPELAYSATAPILVAAAGPRPGEPPRANSTILVAWQMTHVPDSKLEASSPTDARSSLSGTATDGDIHRPYRFCVPDHPALQGALPSCLVAHGTTAVSIWIPANHTETQLPGNKFKRKAMPAPERCVLMWDIISNETHMFAIPNVQACISPDCRLVAYCDPNAGRFVVLDVTSGGDEIWWWPDAAKKDSCVSLGQLGNLHNVTVFEFSADGKTLFVGDNNGGLGLYEVKERIGGPEVRYELGDSGAGTGGLPGGMAELA